MPCSAAQRSGLTALRHAAYTVRTQRVLELDHEWFGRVCRVFQLLRRHRLRLLRRLELNEDRTLQRSAVDNRLAHPGCATGTRMLAKGTRSSGCSSRKAE